ncbi:2-desacetyl-2-hydroxyethyl bacteriochlorophyllide A dehydrogenase [Pullulanibacillus pueri]|uniref:Alcohol dehydrogenase n=1 Tax=Pullulanibacillus pueri TaxID=1437324 RepID=A0A8J2ZW30_9BACL|nr:zinc-binding alcohol dehydrogenase family protein [Pullulanibacillus pueri]MBM7680924.1 2-desacetyl-2-hydroxyethyl bacteriochlorophyllide A dehydrogenase [Pullulanibacillus pueri]GGH81354.1 alcohol dehydrogenase [Pullulanibacillus pueri]
MKVMICDQPHKFSIREIKRPTLRAGEALIKVQRIGICGTDLHAYQGNQPYFTYPRVLGHELSGIVVKTSEEIDAFENGDEVTILPYMECGKCIACRNGKPNCCTGLKVIGVHKDGGMAEYISVPADHLIETKGLSAEQAALIEPFSIGAHAVRRSGLRAGQYIMVIGAGPIGLGVMALAKQKQAKVIAMDVNEERLQFSKEWAKVDATVNPTTGQSMEELARITNGDFPTVVFDATGNQHSMNQSFQYVAHGGTLVFVGLMKHEITFSDPDFHGKELTLMASRNATREDFHFVIENLRLGNIDIKGYLSHRCRFDDLIDHFDKWLQPESKVIKAMVEL